MNNSNKIKLTLRDILIILSAAFASLMAALDIYIVSISAPTIARNFEVSLNGVSLIMIVYTLVLTTTIILFGKLGDIFGIKKVFILGYLIFIIASFLCAISPNFYFLVFGRALQGIGGAMLYAMGLAIVPTYGSPHYKGFAYGIAGTFASLGMLLGAPLGGFIAEYLSWHWIFIINIPMGLLGIFVSVFALKQRLIEPKKFKLDILGFIYSFLAIIFLFTGITAKHGQMFLSIMLILALVFFVIFLIHEFRTKDPLIELKLFKNLLFSVALLSIFIIYLPFAGFNFLYPFFLEDLKGFSPDQSGLIFTFFGLAFLFSSPLLGKLSDRIKPIIFSTIGTLIIAIDFLIFSFIASSANILGIICFVAFFGFGFACFLTPIFNVVMSNVLASYEGTGSALIRTASNFGLAIGLTFFQAVFCFFVPLKFSFSQDSKITLILQNYFQNAFQNVFLISSAIAFIAFLALAGVGFFEKIIKTKS